MIQVLITIKNTFTLIFLEFLGHLYLSIVSMASIFNRVFPLFLIGNFPGFFIIDFKQILILYSLKNRI